MFHGLMGVAFVIERLGGFDRHDLMPMVVTVDGISTLLLAWLVVRSNRIAIRVTDGMTRSYAEAAEYARARQDYEQLLRHRIANPLTVISGGADALLRFEDLDRDTRRQLLSGIASAAESLREASAQTEHSSTEEQGLNGVPDTPRDPCPPRLRAAATSHGRMATNGSACFVVALPGQ